MEPRRRKESDWSWSWAEKGFIELILVTEPNGLERASAGDYGERWLVPNSVGGKDGSGCTESNGRAFVSPRTRDQMREDLVGLG